MLIRNNNEPNMEYFEKKSHFLSEKYKITSVQADCYLCNKGTKNKICQYRRCRFINSCIEISIKEKPSRLRGRIGK